MRKLLFGASLLTACLVTPAAPAETPPKPLPVFVNVVATARFSYSSATDRRSHATPRTIVRSSRARQRRGIRSRRSPRQDPSASITPMDRSENRSGLALRYGPPPGHDLDLDQPQRRSRAPYRPTSNSRVA